MKTQLHPILRDSLSVQSQCPLCGADWKMLLECVNDALPANRIIAQVIMENCHVCKAFIELKTSKKEVF